jgi:ABC transporter substrate binding protein
MYETARFHDASVGSKLVDSLARPGTNVAGLSNFAVQLSAKRLEYLKEAVPRLSRVALLIGGRSRAGIRGDGQGAGASGGRERGGRVRSGENHHCESRTVSRSADVCRLKRDVRSWCVHVDQREIFRRATVYADKILKGTKPAELPVELPRRFELLINIKTARALGLTVPQSLLCEPTKSSNDGPTRPASESGSRIRRVLAALV